MRPCFQAIYNFLFPNSAHSTANISGNLGTYNGHGHSGYALASSERGLGSRLGIGKNGGTGLGFEKSREEKGITKTVDIEMSSRSVSTEDILRSKDQF